MKAGKLQPTPIDYMYGGAVTDYQRPPLGGAGLFSTAEDVTKFYQMMLNHGAFNGHQILKPATVAEMTRKQTGDLKARAGMPWVSDFASSKTRRRWHRTKHFRPAHSVTAARLARKAGLIRRAASFMC
jgi:CubicO group peptidase (beta-lactamase class C family)